MRNLLISLFVLIIPAQAFAEGACGEVGCEKIVIQGNTGVSISNKSAGEISLTQNVNGTAKGFKISATTGDLAPVGGTTVAAGVLTATSLVTTGAIAAGTSLTAGAGIVATTANITASNGLLSGIGLSFPTTSEEVVALAGSTVADAAAMSAVKHIHQLTGANGALGAKFATSTAGQFEILLNTTAGIPKIYAASGGTCNGGAANATCVFTTGIMAHICYSTAVDTWICS